MPVVQECITAHREIDVLHTAAGRSRLEPPRGFVLPHFVEARVKKRFSGLVRSILLPAFPLAYFLLQRSKEVCMIDVRIRKSGKRWYRAVRKQSPALAVLWIAVKKPAVFHIRQDR